MNQDQLIADLTGRLVRLYGAQSGQRTAATLRRMLGAHQTTREAEAFDQSSVITIAYGDHIQEADTKPLAALHSFLNTYCKDFISHLHILPFYPYSSDEGFSVIDYTAVNPELGGWSDIRAIRQDYGLMFDFVLNHMSARSEWFQKFLQDDPQYKDFFISVPEGTDVSATRRPRTHPLLTTFQAAEGERHIWTTFSADQVDLNYRNPEVLLAMTAVMLQYVQEGAQLLRLDAITYAWKEPGTESASLPQTHLLVEVLRNILDIAAPNIQIVTETNVPHVENISYFGDGRHEAQMVYNFALPPLVVHAIQTGNASYLSEWASTLETPGDRTHFFNFTASHDGIGLTPVRHILPAEDIETLVTSVRRNGGFINYAAKPDGTRVPYEMNATFYDAVSKFDDSRELANSKFMVSQAIALSLQGIPGIYLPSLLGAKNWREGAAASGHHRDINRQRFVIGDNFDRLELADAGSERGAIYTAYQRLLEIRARQAAFHPDAPMEVLNLSKGVFAVRRTHADGDCVIALHSITSDAATVQLPQGTYVDLLSSNRGSGTFTLSPYQIAWLKRE